LERKVIDANVKVNKLMSEVNKLKKALDEKTKMVITLEETIKKLEAEKVKVNINYNVFLS